jgi:hypothetical protein
MNIPFRSLVSLLLVACIAVSCPGCSFLGSRTQTIGIASDPDGAEVTINGKHVGETPLEHQIRRSEVATILVKKAGYHSVTKSTNKIPSTLGAVDMVGGYFCLFPFLGLISGAAWEQSPSTFVIALKKEAPPTQLLLKRPQKRTREILVEGAETPQKAEIKDVATPVDVDTNIPKTGKVNKDGIAVIIGNREYHMQDVPRVDFAIRDAAVMRKYVTRALGFRPGNIIYYENATQANFRTVFGSESDHKGKLFSWVKRGRSDVFIYYSGHGAPDPGSKTGYFVPTDCDPATVRLNGYSLKTFYANLARLPARSITVVLDACFSGVSAKGMLLKNVSPVFFQVDNPLLSLEEATLFTSSTGEQISSWYPEKRHGLFTYFFLKGLQGAADSNGDKQVTASEMEAYLKDEVSYMARRLSMREQHPQFMGDKKTVIIKHR